MLKVNVEEKQAEIDGKKINYKSFFVKLDLGSPIGTYNCTIKVESKAEKSLLNQFIDNANLVITKGVKDDGTEYVRPVIEIRDKSKDLEIDITPKLSPDTLVLLRLICQV